MTIHAFTCVCLYEHTYTSMYVFIHIYAYIYGHTHSIMVNLYCQLDCIN